MTNPTRQEMLSAIENKITRKEQAGENVWVNPVMIGDVLDFLEKKWDNMEWKSKNLWTMDSEYARLCKKQNQETIEVVGWWKKKREPLSAQDDDCIAYVYSLL